MPKKDDDLTKKEINTVCKEQAGYKSYVVMISESYVRDTQIYMPERWENEADEVDEADEINYCEDDDWGDYSGPIFLRITRALSAEKAIEETAEKFYLSPKLLRAEEVY